jgi:hypothetical protein
MTWIKKHWLGLALALTVFSALFVIRLRAQTNPPFQMAVGSITHTSCTVTASTTQYCFASDGLWVSLNGAVYTQIGVVAVTGVTSFNGRTGAVLSTTGDYTYAQLGGTPPSAPVTSVNGKTGAVVLGATTTSTTTVQ